MPKQPQDPFPIYKDGEKPRKVHSIDFAGWAAQGWSKEPPSEEVATPGGYLEEIASPEVTVPTTLAPPELPQIPPSEETQEPPTDPPAPLTKGKSRATRPTQPTDPAGQ